MSTLLLNQTANLLKNINLIDFECVNVVKTDSLGIMTVTAIKVT